MPLGSAQASFWLRESECARNPVSYYFKIVLLPHDAFGTGKMHHFFGDLSQMGWCELVRFFKARVWLRSDPEGPLDIMHLTEDVAAGPLLQRSLTGLPPDIGGVTGVDLLSPSSFECEWVESDAGSDRVRPSP